MGTLLVLLSAVGFGSMALFAKIAYEDGVDTANLLALRFVISAALLGILTFTRGAHFPRGRALVNYIFMGLAYSTMAWAYFSALHYASSATVAMVLYTYPILVALTAAALRIDRFGVTEMASLALSFVGLSLLLGGAMQGSSTGVLLATAAAFFYCGYIIIGSRNVYAIDAIACSTVVLTTAAACYVILALLQGPHLPSRLGTWSAVMGLAIFGTALAITAFVAGLKRVGPTQAAVLSTLEPVVTVALGISFLGEQWTTTSITGGVLILMGGVGITLKRRHRVAAAPPAPVTTSS